jgi:hypothetical protein
MSGKRRRFVMARLTERKVKIFNLAKPEQKEEYEKLLNDPDVSHIDREEFVYSKKTDLPIITVWYTIYVK